MEDRNLSFSINCFNKLWDAAWFGSFLEEDKNNFIFTNTMATESCNKEKKKIQYKYVLLIIKGAIAHV